MKARKLHARDSPSSSYVPRSDASDEEDEVSYVGTSQSSQSQSQPSEQVKHEVGIIEEIYCENFMCHRKMVVKLGRNINFITGENGSGKSAIIAALQICLGASARTTHRGKSLKNLIRNSDGEQPRHALVRITLFNDGTGSDAFRPEQFGPRIQVERIIRSEGTAEYRLKDSGGHLVSKSKADLEAMLDHLNIQIENPCAVLDQENAKLFLKGDPVDKYKFFLQSTDLYKMRAVFAKVEDETKVRKESTLEHEQRKVQLLENACAQAEKMYEKAKSFAHLEEKLEAVKHSLAWSFVNLKETECATMRAELEESIARAEGHRKNVIKYDAQVEQLTAEHAELKKILETEEQNIAQLTQQQEMLKQRQKQLQYPLQLKNAERKQLEMNLQKSKKRLEGIEREKANKRQRFQEYVKSLESKQARAAQELQAIQNKLDDALETKRQLERRGEVNFTAELNQLNDELDNIKAQRRDLQNERERVSNRLATIRDQAKNRLLAFGNGVPYLNELIQDNLHRFSQPPIGPLGLFISIPEHKNHWTLAVELILKNVLNSYLVASGPDKALLDRLKAKANCRQVSILIAKRSSQRYSGLHVPSGSLRDHAVASILSVEDPNVFNVLVDVAKIESKLIFDSRKEGEEKAIASTSGRSVQFHPNIVEVYIPNGDKFFARKGNLGFIANKTYKHARILSQDHSAEEHELSERLNVLNRQYQVLKRDEEQRIERGNAMHREQEAHERHLQDTSRTIHTLETELNRAKRQQDQSMDTSIGDTTVLDDEKIEIEYEMTTMHTRLQTLNEELEHGDPNIAAITNELSELQTQEHCIRTTLNDTKERAMALYQRLMQSIAKKLKATQHAEKHEADINDKTRDVQAMEAQVEDSIAKATTICPRLKIKFEHPSYYNTQIKELTHRLSVEKAQFDNMDLAELEIDVQEKRGKLNQKALEFQAFSDNVHQVSAMLVERKLKWAALRKEIATRTSMGFNKYMKHRNFAGKLKFHHDDQRLDIAVVANDGGTKLSIVNDMKQLSGGERSYTQVALLMALGECIECPFRVMDEFDVFMDSINRTQTLQLLIDTAKTEKTKQFIFVTPNDLSSIREDRMVKIQKLQPPRDRFAGHP
ncbi:hypothetical protein H310_14361 [Aphanomyces invadans]|uniref:RecF/RecN/SMC N-terminal domain-containing protein n=1 Tax=Aphanomyces invadans TaxID=157072 RepID=A0A024TCA9_9STRA|nr:hypothetical protein H310_14361 [Aphanomyces invadans]ETV90947.1 hypothetical protein H310_14361 [Aphanomyces invadans]|eukprot:XP_008880429.1 hypothetical protein H310_14361 [Aphanomyces invadans]